MTNRQTTYLTLSVVCLAAALTPLPGDAAETGGSSYLPGFYGDFGMAVTPAPGNYLSNFAGYYTAEENGSNNHLLFELPGIMRVTETKIFGGNYWLGFFPYVLHTGFSSTAPNGIKNQSSRGGAGDMYAMPFALSWQWQDLSILVFEGIVLPTGAYDKNRAINAGRNYWTFDNNLSLTWLPKGTDLELSVTLGYMVNTENPATHYRTGDELHFDYFGGYYFTPSFGVGIAGSFYRQLSVDTGAGAPSGLELAEYSSIGPAAMYTLKMGEKDVTFSLKWLHEYNVNNHIPGDYVIVRTGLNF